MGVDAERVRTAVHRLSYLLAPMSIAASALTYKAIAAIASLATVALLWNAARLRALTPLAQRHCSG